MPVRKNETPIASLADWERLAPPDSAKLWSPGRSALEAAKAWLESDVDLPRELATALKRHDAFGRATTWWAEPAVRLAFDASTGERRDGDLVVHVEDAHGAYLIVVVAKADEPFGDSVGDTLAAAMDRLVEDSAADDMARAIRLVTAVLGPRVDGDPLLKDLRYQLLTAAAGCLCEAERLGHSRALLLIHEFVTDRTADEKLLRNAIDLGRFVKRLSHGAANAVGPGEIRGPFHVPGAPLLSATIDLYVGKVSRNLRKQRD